MVGLEVSLHMPLRSIFLDLLALLNVLMHSLLPPLDYHVRAEDETYHV